MFEYIEIQGRLEITFYKGLRPPRRMENKTAGRADKTETPSTGGLNWEEGGGNS